MTFKKYAYAIVGILLLQASNSLAAIVIQAPAKAAVIDANHLTIEVNGSCTKGQTLKINAVDSVNKATDYVWTICQSWGFSVMVNISPLKDGAVKVNVIQNVTKNPQSASIGIVKQAVPVVVVPPVVVPPVVASTIKIQSPASAAVFKAGNLSIEVNGACTAGMILKVSAIDTANKATGAVWTQCQSWGFSVIVDLSTLADGAITVNVIQDATNPMSASVGIVKNTAAVVVPPVVVTPTPTPTPSPAPVSSSVVIGVNGHDGRTYWPMSDAEARFKLMDSKNLRSYRFDIDPRNFTVLDQLVVLAKKYNITLRPMAYPISQTDMTLLQTVSYAMAKRYANDIKIWELGNEQDSDRAGAQGRINALVAMYKGVKQASDETGAGLKTTINIMACNDDDTTGRCAGDKNGDMWFLDMAKASGFNFDYISFHYYAYFSDKGYWMDKFMGQLRGAAVKYNTKIFFNETNCADIYQGNTDGGHAGDKACYDSIVQLLNVVKTSYSDVVAEVNMYELIDDPEAGGVESHFGLMYNLNSPKPSLTAVANAAAK